MTSWQPGPPAPRGHIFQDLACYSYSATHFHDRIATLVITNNCSSSVLSASSLALWPPPAALTAHQHLSQQTLLPRPQHCFTPALTPVGGHGTASIFASWHSPSVPFSPTHMTQPLPVPWSWTCIQKRMTCCWLTSLYRCDYQASPPLFPASWKTMAHFLLCPQAFHCLLMQRHSQPVTLTLDHWDSRNN